LEGLDFGVDVDGADDADGRTPVLSGIGWLGVVLMRIVRVRARPSRLFDADFAQKGRRAATGLSILKTPNRAEEAR
jgi:hypothetical protein